MIVKATCTFDNRVANPLEVIDISGVVLVQLWCNWHGKDGFYAFCELFLVHSIERVDGIFPHIQDVQYSRPIRSQTLNL